MEAVGSNVTNFEVGDRVLGAADGIVSRKLENAAFQTYTIVRASSAFKLPSNITFEQAATLPTGTVSDQAENSTTSYNLVNCHLDYCVSDALLCAWVAKTRLECITTEHHDPYLGRCL